MAKVAIIGAAGYVGRELIRQFQDMGHELIGITRRNGKLLLQDFNVRVEEPDKIGEIGTADIVINLAYPNTGSIYQYSERNREILAMIEQLAGESGRVIHVSTQAVFGYQLEYSVEVGPVNPRRDYLYIESKIELENLLLKAFAHRDLHIVRLGNVWGPASPMWTVQLIDRLLYQEPIGVMGIDGFSNATDVANVASYLIFLTTTAPSDTPSFHHLAELAETRWSLWIEKISEALKLDPVYVTDTVHYPRSAVAEFKEMFADFRPARIYRKLIWGRFTGSMLRSMVRRVPPRIFNIAKASTKSPSSRGAKLSPADEIFLTILSCQKLFTNRVQLAWKPVVHVEESWQRIKDWMRRSGYFD